MEPGGTRPLHLPRARKGAAEPIDDAWQMATVGDLALPEVEGWLLTATEHDPVLTERFPRVNHLIDPPPELFHPAVLRRESWPGTSAPAHPAVPDLTPSAAGTASP